MVTVRPMPDICLTSGLMQLLLLMANGMPKAIWAGLVAPVLHLKNSENGASITRRSS